MKKELEKRKTEVVAQWRSEGGGRAGLRGPHRCFEGEEGARGREYLNDIEILHLDDAIHKKLIVLFCTLRRCPDEILTNSVTETAHR